MIDFLLMIAPWHAGGMSFTAAFVGCVGEDKGSKTSDERLTAWLILIWPITLVVTLMALAKQVWERL